MCLCKVYHVDVVANTGSVGRVVVVSKYLQLFSDAHCCLRNEGDEVVGNAVGKFADECRRVRADGVEVAKDDALNGCAAVDVVAYNLFVNLLGIAVRAASLLDGCVFGYGKMLFGGLTVHRAA